VVQEALSNVHRHAAASVVQVRMKATTRLLVLSIADNGHGLDGSQAEPHSRRRPSGLGLPGMHARVHQLGGTMRILTGAQGTTVHARIPLARCRA
jgi:signal transduction histidine kinase